MFRVSNEEYAAPDDAVEVLLIRVSGKAVWGIPKGAIEKGESPETAALREVREETGVSAEIAASIGDISYGFFLRDSTCRVSKTVHFYLMKYLSGSTLDHDHEVDEAAWMKIEAALGVMTYASERDIMKKARVMIHKLI
ncbi:MAG: NUDIX hydrolase [Nitrospira sp.]|nr:NUDIX hydrolase [Nitrospira sp.]